MDSPEYIAKLRGAPVSAQKARLVVDQIRGKKVDYAVNYLNFCSKKSAHLIKKLLESAIANAEDRGGVNVDDLVVTTAFVDEGMTLKRIQPRAKGRADRICKRTSHITLKVSEVY